MGLDICAGWFHDVMPRFPTSLLSRITLSKTSGLCRTILSDSFYLKLFP
jgi:hypothetical protein